jgi:hypothetical protein
MTAEGGIVETDAIVAQVWAVGNEENQGEFTHNPGQLVKWRFYVNYPKRLSAVLTDNRPTRLQL